MLEQNELLSRLAGISGLKWYIAMETDEFLSRPIADIDAVDVSKLFEIRAWCDDYEIKAVRGALEDGFLWRDTRDIDVSEGFGAVMARKTAQYLDVDDKKGPEARGGYVQVSATGGGEYGLPSDAIKKVEIENYYKADDSGFYNPFDFRIVRFL